jgi:membrane-associated protease RseP (regulator of RpoE activity)
MAGLPKQIKNPHQPVGILFDQRNQSYFGFLSRFSAFFSLAVFVATFFVSFFASLDFAILLSCLIEDVAAKIKKNLDLYELVFGLIFLFGFNTLLVLLGF